MDVVKLQVQTREAAGRNQVRRLREQGMLPAVLYGAGRDTVKLAVSEREFDRHMREHHKVFLLQLAGREQAIFLQEVQWDCLTDRPMHVDFLRIDLKDKIESTAEIVFVGHPKGASRGGTLIHDMNALPIISLPADLPDKVEIKVADMDLGDALTAADIPLPAGVELACPSDAQVCHMPGEEKVLAEMAEKAELLAGEGEAEESGEPEVVGQDKKDEGPSES